MAWATEPVLVVASVMGCLGKLPFNSNVDDGL